METLLSKLVLPLVVALALSALGIVVLFVQMLKSRAEEEEEDLPRPARASSRAPDRAYRSFDSGGGSSPHDTVVIDRRALKDGIPPAGSESTRSFPQVRQGPEPSRQNAPPPPTRPPARTPDGPRPTDTLRRSDLRGVDPRRPEPPRPEPARPEPPRPDLARPTEFPRPASPPRTVEGLRASSDVSRSTGELSPRSTETTRSSGNWRTTDRSPEPPPPATSRPTDTVRGDRSKFLDTGRPQEPPRAAPPVSTGRLTDTQRPTSRSTESGRLPSNVGEPPTIPMGTPLGPQRRGASTPLQSVGSNIVLNQPLSQAGYIQLPGKLDIIYGNFSPTDPREIPFLWSGGDNTPPRYTFSKSPGEGVSHIQLNHYTITSGIQAELRFVDGKPVLVNMIEPEDMERYQTRVNGIPLGPGESSALSSGDIISMGIYRLKLSV